jgi:uncharacterized protein with HEPN domain
MKPSNRIALNQALDSIAAIQNHLQLMPLSEALTYDAVCMRLLVIGENLKLSASPISCIQKPHCS